MAERRQPAQPPPFSPHDRLTRHSRSARSGRAPLQKPGAAPLAIGRGAAERPGDPERAELARGRVDHSGPLERRRMIRVSAVPAVPGDRGARARESLSEPLEERERVPDPVLEAQTRAGGALTQLSGRTMCGSPNSSPRRGGRPASRRARPRAARRPGRDLAEHGDQHGGVEAVAVYGSAWASPCVGRTFPAPRLVASSITWSSISCWRSKISTAPPSRVAATSKV